MVRLGIPVALMVALSGCSGGCANEVIRRVNAPDELHTAVLFQRDCGSTTSFSTQISVLDQNDQPTGGGNVFRADDNHGAAKDGDWGGPWADVKWLAADHLLIRYAARSRLFAQGNNLSGVRITYQQVTG